MHATLPLMRSYGFPALRRGRLETLQVNLGYKCNQSCLHCHVNAGPARTEAMSAEVVADEEAADDAVALAGGQHLLAREQKPWQAGCRALSKSCY
jgi:uncharacterized Fe-S cluster-containing radical SAM superfamily enzyme